MIQPLVAAYLQKPAAMLFAKCIPHSIEGMMIGAVNSIITVTSEIITRLLAVLVCEGLNDHEGITIENYSGLAKKMMCSLPYAVIGPLILSKFLIDRN